MTVMTRVGLVACASGLALCSASFADGVANETEMLRAEVAALRAEIAQMGGSQDWLTDQRADEIRGLVQDVLADADTRASLLQSGMNAGYDNGFFIGTADGNFSLKINGLLQTRFIYNYRSDWPDGDSDPAKPYDFDTNRWGFDMNNTWLNFSGNIVNPDWTYNLRAGVDGTTGDFELQDAWLAYAYGGSGWSMMAGQFKVPLLQENLIDDQYQLAVNRSVVNQIFGLGRTQGLALKYSGDQFRFIGSFNDGAFTDNTVWDTEDTEFAFSARAEILFAGTWDQMKDFTSFRGEETAFMLGGGLHWEKSEYGTGTGSGILDPTDPDFSYNDNEIEFISFEIDGTLEFGGANLFGYFVYRDVEVEGADNPNQWAFLVQGGFFLSDEWELFGRYEYTNLDITDTDDISLFTVGVNKYFAKHGAKWTTDFGFGFNSLSTDFGDATGWQEDAPGEDGQFVFRSQFQLHF